MPQADTEIAEELSELRDSSAEYLCYDGNSSHRLDRYRPPGRGPSGAGGGVSVEYVNDLHWPGTSAGSASGASGSCLRTSTAWRSITGSITRPTSESARSPSYTIYSHSSRRSDTLTRGARGVLGSHAPRPSTRQTPPRGRAAVCRRMCQLTQYL